MDMFDAEICMAQRLLLERTSDWTRLATLVLNPVKSYIAADAAIFLQMCSDPCYFPRFLVLPLLAVFTLHFSHPIDGHAVRSSDCGCRFFISSSLY